MAPHRFHFRILALLIAMVWMGIMLSARGSIHGGWFAVWAVVLAITIVATWLPAR
jgi:hypothetical protein